MPHRFARSTAILLNPKHNTIRLISQSANEFHISTPSPIRKAKPPTTQHLEVEAKFTPTPASLVLLRNNGGTPPFTTHVHLGTHTFKDTYHDTPLRLLKSHNIWLRYRSPPGIFELKTRAAGCYQRSAFVETKGREDVEGAVRKFVPDAELCEDGSTSSAFEVMVQLTTTREEWRVGPMTKIAVDQTEQGLFGELEIEVPVQEAVGVEGDAVKRLEKERDKFMERYGWAFPGKDGVIVGKLAAAIIASRGEEGIGAKQRMGAKGGMW